MGKDGQGEQDHAQLTADTAEPHTFVKSFLVLFILILVLVLVLIVNKMSLRDNWL